MAPQLFTHSSRYRVAFWIVGAIAGIIACIWLFPSPGTGDVAVYEQIIESFRVNGREQLATCIRETCPGHSWNYPPLYLYVLFAGLLTGGQLLNNFVLHKTVIAFFVTITFVLLGYFASVHRPQHMSRPAAILRGLFLGLTGMSVLINALGLGYIDIYTYPFVILSLILLTEKKFFFSGVLLACGFLMKWIPLLMLPFYVLYLFRKGKKELGLFLMGVIVPVIIIGWTSWGWNFLPDYLRGMTVISRDPYFSAAPNIPWIWMTLFPSLMDKPSDSIYIFLDEMTKPSVVLIYNAFKLVFIGFYLWILYIYHTAASKRSIGPLLIAATYAYLGYYFINSGVHENHLVLGVLCALLLAIMDTGVRSQWRYRSVDIISAGGMILHYGVSGTPFFPTGTALPIYPFSVALIFSYWFIVHIPQLKKDISD